MKDSQAESRFPQSGRLPYHAPEIEHLGSVADLTAANNGAAGSDGVYGATAPHS